MHTSPCRAYIISTQPYVFQERFQHTGEKKWISIHKAVHIAFYPNRVRKTADVFVALHQCIPSVAYKVSSVKSVPLFIITFYYIGRNRRKSLYLSPTNYYLENKRFREVCHKFDLYFGSCRIFSRCALKYSLFIFFYITTWNSIFNATMKRW